MSFDSKTQETKMKSDIHESLFNPKKVPDDAKSILENFDSIIQGILPLNSRQFSKLPDDIRELSHQLTDERSSRRMHYMNDKVFLSAYARYFMWWNLIRLTKLFSNINFDSVNLSDGDFCLDIGSGPLTVVTALWLSRPELRSKKITWYCLDISKEVLSLGENIFLSVAAKTLSDSEEELPWKIIRVKGSFGTMIKEKAKLITCANMFNEVFQSETHPLTYLAQKYSSELKKYAAENASYLIVEPGVPHSARFITCLRECFISGALFITAPCCHTQSCPMDGKLLKGPHVKNAGTKSGKWCNFAFNTDDAPAKLKKLSSDAKLPKDRAVLSFIFASSHPGDKKTLEKKPGDFSNTRDTGETLLLRIASDPIRLYDKTGFYACSKKGLVLFIPKKGKPVFSGDLITVELPKNDLQRDKKSGALIIEG